MYKPLCVRGPQKRPRFAGDSQKTIHRSQHTSVLTAMTYDSKNRHSTITRRKRPDARPWANQGQAWVLSRRSCTERTWRPCATCPSPGSSSASAPRWGTGPSAAAAKALQSCPTLCDPTDRRPLDSPIPGILQARTLEWVAISFSNAWKWKVKGKLLSRVRLFATPWTAAYQAPPSVGFSRQEYWNGVPLPSPLDIQRKPRVQHKSHCLHEWFRHSEPFSTGNGVKPPQIQASRHQRQPWHPAFNQTAVLGLLCQLFSVHCVTLHVILMTVSLMWLSTQSLIISTTLTGASLVNQW